MNTKATNAERGERIDGQVFPIRPRCVATTKAKSRHRRDEAYAVRAKSILGVHHE